jgi:hypothetical protein
MPKLHSISAAAFLLFSGADAVLAESANFETNGFPISLHQAHVTGLVDIRETTPGAMLAVGGIPASPHQLAVLSPRKMHDMARRVARTEQGISTETATAAR